MSTFKYVCAVFLRINDLNDDDQKVMGWILVVLDVVFMVASVVVLVWQHFAHVELHAVTRCK